MSIRYLIEDIEDYEREICNLKIRLEFSQSQVKLFRHKANVERDNDYYKRIMWSLANDYAEQYTEYRSKLSTAERNLRVAKLRLKKYFEEV